VRGLGGFAEAGQHPVPGLGRLLAGGLRLFPALVLGVFWKRANRWGAVAGMLSGLGVTFWYMATTHPWLRGLFGLQSPVHLWWDIDPISAGVFGVPVGFAVIIAVSLLTPPPPAEVREFVERLRYPRYD
jgi:cation/acetate symporter